MKNRRLFSTRRPFGFVLFSYGGKAVKQKESYARAAVQKNESLVSEKIIDYATLQSWYNEQKAAKAAAGELGDTRDADRKQRNMKFMML